MVHSHPGTQLARRQIAIFREEGVDLTRVKIDHSNDTTDIEYLEWILDQGCFLGLDRYPGRLVSPRMRTLTLKKLIDLGHGDRLCPSHDCICVAVLEEGPDGTLPETHDFFRRNPDQYLYMHRQVIPMLRELGTGDLAVRDADGYLWYQGRADDVFKSAGYRIGPSEIENCLVKHPAVANAAVVPKPDAERGALVKAYVVLSPDALAARGAAASAQAYEDGVRQALQAHVRGLLAPYEYPKEIEFIDQLPMTTTGKVQRRVLRLQEEERARSRA